VTKQERYEAALREVDAILVDEGTLLLDDIALMATINSVLANAFEDFFWTGFYRVFDRTLVVGPYIGTVGCLEIPFGKGVCGAAAAKRQTVIVPDVTKFPGHIACDAKSKSEIVVPVFNGRNEMIAVLDVDSERLAAFDEEDQAGLERICSLFANR
jgi:GAF domain-containing protein